MNISGDKMTINIIITKYIDLLYKTFLDENIERCLSKAMYHFDMLSTIDGDCAVVYFQKLSEKNVALAVHVFCFYKRYTNQSTEKIKEVLVDQTSYQLQMLEKCEFVDLHRLRQEMMIAQRNNNAIDEGMLLLKNQQATELYRVADICFASLALNDSELIHGVFELIGNIIKDDDSCDLFVDRFLEQLNSTSEIDRGILAVRFLSNIYYRVKIFNDTFSLKMVLHFKLISTIVGKRYIGELIAFSKDLINHRDYRFLRHVIGCFSEVSLKVLGIDEKALARKIFEEYPSVISFMELYQGLRTVEDFNNCNSNVTESLNYWWGIVENDFKEIDKKLEDEYDFFKIYYYLRQIQNNPHTFLQFDNLEDKCVGDEYLKLINIAEQNATVAILHCCPENVETFIKWLGNWNFYKFDVKEIRFPWAGRDDNGKEYISILSKNYTPEKMVYIYMNSFLRSVVPINILLNKLYDISERQRDDYLMVRKLFSPYQMCAKLYMYNDNPSLEAVSFNEKGMNIYNFSDTVKSKLKDYYNKNKNNDSFAYIHFHIAAALVKKDFTPDIHLEYAEFLDQDVKELNDEAFNRCLDILNELSTRRKILKEDIVNFNTLPKFNMTPEKASAVGMSIIRVLINLTNNRERTNLLKQLKNNPYRCSNIARSLSFGTLKDNSQLRTFLNKVVKDNGFFEQKLFLYFNTALRLNISFETFIRKSEVLNGRLFLDKIFLSQELYCVGKVFKVIHNKDKKTVIIRPKNVMASRMVKHVLYTNDDLTENEFINYIVKYYDGEKGEFVVGEYKIRERRNSLYCDAVAKASKTTKLGEIDKYNLQQKMDSISIKRNRWKLATYEAEAIYLRKDNKNELYTFQSLIEKGSPWSFTLDQLPCYYANRKKYGFIDSMLIDLIRKFDVEFVVELYFNTSLRSFVSLDEMCCQLDNEGKLDSKAFAAISQYPIKLGYYLGHLRGYNVLFLRDLDELLADIENTDELYVVDRFDIKEKQVKLKVLDRIPLSDILDMPGC